MCIRRTRRELKGGRVCARAEKKGDAYAQKKKGKAGGDGRTLMCLVPSRSFSITIFLSVSCNSGRSMSLCKTVMSNVDSKKALISLNFLAFPVTKVISRCALLPFSGCLGACAMLRDGRDDVWGVRSEGLTE